MTEDEARRVTHALQLAGLPGQAVPVRVDEPEGPWRIADGAGRDITLGALDALIEHLGGDPSGPAEPGWHNGRPVRGFVFPTSGRG